MVEKGQDTQDSTRTLDSQLSTFDLRLFGCGFAALRIVRNLFRENIVEGLPTRFLV